MNFHELNMNYFERFWNRFLKNFSRSDSLLFGQTRGSAPTRGESDKAECGKIQIYLVFRSLICTFGCRRARLCRFRSETEKEGTLVDFVFKCHDSAN